MRPGVKRLAAVLVLAVSFGLAGCGGGSQTLDAEALKKQAEALESLAAEGALLAANVSEGDTTRPFVRVHAEALGKNTETVVAALAPDNAQPAAGLSEQISFAHTHAEVVRAELARLAKSPSAGQAASIRDHLEFEAERARRLAESL
jgi:hypothetical protein